MKPKMTCRRCGIPKFETDFNFRSPSQRRGVCKACEKENPHNRLWHRKQRIIRNKRRAIKYLGGKCSCIKCPLPSDYKVPDCCFDFHHRDSTSKDVDVNRLLQGNWNKIQKELDKCDLLCCLCHRISYSYNNHYSDGRIWKSYNPDSLEENKNEN